MPCATTDSECTTIGVCELANQGPVQAILDPHFLGLDGHKYDFQGEPNKTFALISDSQVQVNSRFVDAGMKDKNNHSKNATYLGDICVRYCDSTAIFTTDGTVTLSGPVTSNLVVERHANGTATLTVGLWSMLVESSGHSHHNLKSIQLRHPIMAGPMHGVLCVTAPDPHSQLTRPRNGTHMPTVSSKKEAHPPCQPKNEGGCEVPGEWRDYEVEGNDLCGIKFKYSKFDHKKCVSIAANIKRGVAEVNLLQQAQQSILP